MDNFMRLLSQAFILLCLVGVTGTVTAQIEKLDKVVALVNDDIITENELANEISIREQQMLAQGLSLPETTVLREQLLEQLIVEQLQLQYAAMTGIQLDEMSLDQLVASIAERNQLTVDQLRAELKKEQLDFAQFRQRIKKEYLLAQLQQRDIANRIEITPQEVEQFLHSRAGQLAQGMEYHLQHLLLPVPENPDPEAIEATQKSATKLMAQLKQGAKFTDLAIQHSRGPQALNGGDLGWRKLAELPTLFVDLVPNMQVKQIEGPIRSPSGFHLIQLVATRVNPQEQTLVEKTKVQHILVQPNAMVSDEKAQQKLAKLKTEIEQGGSFTELAKTYSDDLGSARKGGQLGWVMEGDLVPEFNAVMQNLAKQQISAPFKTSFGWHIVQVLDRQIEDDAQWLLTQKAQQMIKKRKVEEKLETWLRQLRDEAYVKILSDATTA